MSVHCYDITCCGVAFSDRGQWLCAGDMAGGVSVMQGSNRKATYNCSVTCECRYPYEYDSSSNSFNSNHNCDYHYMPIFRIV